MVPIKRGLVSQSRWFRQISSVGSSIEQAQTAAKMKAISDIPTLPSYPIVKSLPFMWKYMGDEGFNLKKCYFDVYKECGDIALFELPGLKQIVLFDDYVQVYQTEGKYPDGTTANMWYQKLVYDRNGIEDPLLSVGERWRETRHRLQPYLFAPQAVKEKIGMVNEACAAISQHFKEYENEIPQFSRCSSFDMFFSISLGTQFRTVDKDQKNEFALKFMQTTSDAFRLGSALGRKKYLQNYQWLLDYHSKFKEYETVALKSRKYAAQAMREMDKEKNGVMQNFIRSEFLSEEESLTYLDNLIVAGIDTTRFAIQNILLTLAENPDKQQKLREELYQLLNGADYDPSLRYPYLKACIHESMRLNPLTPVLLRSTSVDLNISGYHIPKGTVVFVSTLKYSQSEEYTGKDPEKFMPERYLPVEVEKRKGTSRAMLDHPTVKMPFSFGARMCLGARIAEMELRAVVCRLVQDHEFTIDPSSPPYECGVHELLTVAKPYPKFSIRSL